MQELIKYCRSETQRNAIAHYLRQMLMRPKEDGFQVETQRLLPIQSYSEKYPA